MRIVYPLPLCGNQGTSFSEPHERRKQLSGMGNENNDIFEKAFTRLMELYINEYHISDTKIPSRFYHD